MSLTVQVPPLYRPPQLVTSGGQDWRSIQTCSLKDPPLIGPEIWWLLKTYMWSAQAGTTYPTGLLSVNILK